MLSQQSNASNQTALSVACHYWQNGQNTQTAHIPKSFHQLVLAALIIPVTLLCSFAAAHNCMSSTFAKQTGKGGQEHRTPASIHTHHMQYLQTALQASLLTVRPDV